MNIAHFDYRGIHLIGGFQCWSNPQRAGTEASIPVVLSRPTFLDLVSLSLRFGVNTLMQINNDMLASGDLSVASHRRNQDNLKSIQIGIGND